MYFKTLIGVKVPRDPANSSSFSVLLAHTAKY